MKINGNSSFECTDDPSVREQGIGGKIGEIKGGI